MITIDPSNGNVLTDVAMTGSGNAFVPGLAFDASGTLYGSRGNSAGRTEDLVIIDPTTGVQTPVGELTDVIADIVFVGSTLFGGSPQSQNLYVIDPTTGVKTIDFNVGFRIGGLATAEAPLGPVPEPATLLLFGTTAVGLGLARWRRRKSG